MEKVKVHYFRQFDSDNSLDLVFYTHNRLPGCHGKKPTYCKACVVAVVAIIEKDGDTFVGVALRNPIDQFNSKIGRAIAIGRARKDEGYGGALTGVYLDWFNEKIKRSYQLPSSDILACWRAYVR